MPRALYLVIALLAAVTHAVTIVVFQPPLDEILREAFPQAQVISMVPPGVDPHDYQLTAGDIATLRGLGQNDVIISTAHLPAEVRAAELAQRGEIKARIIDLTGVLQYLTWSGGLVRLGGSHEGVNLHEHGVYIPNVLRLVEEVANATGLAPEENFVKKLIELNLTYAGKYSGRAVAITPPAQYVLYWLGYRDVAVLIREPELPPAPEDLQKALDYVRHGAPAVAVITKGEGARIIQDFKKKAEEIGITPRIYVLNLTGGYLDGYERFLQTFGETPTTATMPQTPAPSEAIYIILIIAALAAVATAILAQKRRKKG